MALRYVERNALRANLVDRAERWEWGSLNWRLRGSSPLALAEAPIALPPDWTRLGNTPQTEEELAAVRNSVNRQCPYGSDEWVKSKAIEFGLEQTMAPLGRPGKLVTRK